MRLVLKSQHPRSFVGWWGCLMLLSQNYSCAVDGMPRCPTSKRSGQKKDLYSEHPHENKTSNWIFWKFAENSYQKFMENLTVGQAIRPSWPRQTPSHPGTPRTMLEEEWPFSAEPRVSTAPDGRHGEWNEKPPERLTRRCATRLTRTVIVWLSSGRDRTFQTRTLADWNGQLSVVSFQNCCCF